MGTQPLQIGDGSGWHFFNGAWSDGEAGALVVPEAVRRSDGPNLQGHHYAFRTGLALRDVNARLEFKLAAHSDVGLIVRAADESHFHVVHFPNCGQQSRAQHFWVALSRMDESGFLRCTKLEMVRRVPSNKGRWLTADVRLTGKRLRVVVGDHGIFEAEDETLPEVGAVGVYYHGSFAPPELRQVVVEGTAAEAFAWNSERRQPTNWYYPCPKSPVIWQKPKDLVRLAECGGAPPGELLLGFSERASREYNLNETFLSRSRDNGSTWSTPEPLAIRDGGTEFQAARLHRTPGGRLVALVTHGGAHWLAESKDGARSWSRPERLDVGPRPRHLKSLHAGPQAFLNLRDGSMVHFLYGGCDLAAEDLSIYTWGATHCQAFASRSTDDGRTWSPLVNVDNADFDDDRSPYEGNMDLTEVCGAEMGQDGRILALIRPVYSPWMWETWSEDGGSTWGPCVRGPFPGYATPNMLRTSGGATLVAHRLPSMTIHCSWDDGHTWNMGTMIDSAVWVMGAMIEIEPDVVLFVYHDTHETLMRAMRFRVTRDGLQPIRPVD